jgi:hypothetical protein
VQGHSALVGAQPGHALRVAGSEHEGLAALAGDVDLYGDFFAQVLQVDDEEAARGADVGVGARKRHRGLHVRTSRQYLPHVRLDFPVLDQLQSPSPTEREHTLD